MSWTASAMISLSAPSTNVAGRPTARSNEPYSVNMIDRPLRQARAAVSLPRKFMRSFSRLSFLLDTQQGQEINFSSWTSKKLHSSHHKILATV